MLDQLIIDYIKSSKDQVAIFTDVYTTFYQEHGSWNIYYSIQRLKQSNIIDIGICSPYGSKISYGYYLIKKISDCSTTIVVERRLFL